MRNSQVNRKIGKLDAQHAFAFVFACIFFCGITFFIVAPAPEKPWDALTGISTWGSVLALLAAAWVAMRQLSQLRAAYQVDAFIRAADSIDSHEFREALAHLRNLEPVFHNRDALLEHFHSLNKKEAEKFWERIIIIGNSIERIGAMIEYGALDRRMILDYMAPVIVHAYYALEFRWRDRSPGEGWVFMEVLANEAIAYLDDVVRSQPKPCYLDTVAAGDLSVSLRVDCKARRLAPYRIVGNERYYRVLAYVKNATDRRVRAKAEVTLNVLPPYRFRSFERSRETGAPAAGGRRTARRRYSPERVQPSTAPKRGFEARPKSNETEEVLSSQTVPATLAIPPNDRQAIASVLIAGPGGPAQRCTWRIVTLDDEAATYEGFIDVDFGTGIDVRPIEQP